MEIFTFFASLFCISTHPSSYRKDRKYYIAIGGVLLALTTLEYGMDALWGEYMWIDHRNYPGGPLGYFAATGNSWYNILGLALGATVNILGDGLLVRSVSPSRRCLTH